MTDPAKADERNKVWSDIYVEIMEDAPWAPVFNEQRFTMHSPRMGGADKLYRRPGPHPDQLRLRVRQRCAVTATTPSTGATTISAGTTRFAPAETGRAGLDASSSSASTPRAASSRPDSTVADVPTLDFAKVNPVTGPIYVDGAEPGDALKVTIETFKPSGFGWTANIPGFGLLADQFTEPALHIWNYDAASHDAGALSAQMAACR